MCGDVAAQEPPAPDACNARSTDDCFCVSPAELIALRAKANLWDEHQAAPAVETAPVSTISWSGIGALLASILIAVVKLIL